VYTEEIKRTWNDDADRDRQVEHCVLGIKSEVGEYLSALKKVVGYGKELDITNVIEELGDLYYFTCTLDRVLNVNQGIVEPVNKIGSTTTRTLQTMAGDIFNAADGFNAYFKGQEDDCFYRYYLHTVFTHINDLCTAHSLNPDEVREANIRKLRARFPEKFEVSNAENRNLDAERDAITNQEG
jgi:NTP pyrophosphatase (non-canonical NTP hydrolase)